jgi:hypothetical protein
MCGIAGIFNDADPLTPVDRRLLEMVEFSLQMPGNAFLFAVLCAIALHRTPSTRS